MRHSTRYRMYVDESGDDVMDPAKWPNPESRYLGLTGVVIDKEAYRMRTHPEFEALKQAFFPYDPDEPVVLVRSQIIRRRQIFWPLQNQDVAARWEAGILQFSTDTSAESLQQFWIRPHTISTACAENSHIVIV